MTALNVSTRCLLREDDSGRTCIPCENSKVIAKWLTPKAEEEGLSDDPSRQNVAKQQLDVQLSLQSRPGSKLLSVNNCAP